MAAVTSEVHSSALSPAFMRAAPIEKYTNASVATAGARQWSFQAMVVTSGASELETATTSELLKLIASDAQLSSWTRRCSYRVVSRNDVEALVRRMKVEQLLAAQVQLERDRDAAAADKEEDVETEASDAQDQTLDAASSSLLTTENASLAGSNSQKAMLTTSEGMLPTLEENLVMTPQLLAAAFQRLVLDDKKEFTEFITVNAALSSSPPEDEQQAEFLISSKGDELTSSSSDSTRSSSTDLLSALPAREGTPARIYFLTEYPSSLAEMHALLHTEGAGTIVQDELPLLPLIDGVLLLLDPIKELQDRRKSISLPNDRRKSVSQKNIAGLERKFSLVDVDSMGELEKLNPATVGPCVFQTVNPVVCEWYDAASVGGLEWSDFVFMDLSVPQQAATKELKVLVELVTGMLTSTETLAAQKREFKAWVSTTKVIPIPKACLGSEDEGDNETSKTLTIYEQILAPVYEASVGVSTVIFAMKEAIACFGEGNDNVVLSQSNDDNQSYMEEFLTHSDNAALRLAVAYTTFIMQQQGHHNSNSNAPDPRCILGTQIDAVEKDMWSHSDLPGVGNRGRKGMPVAPLVTPADRSVRDTELARFSSLDVAQVHLTQQLLQFEELLGSPWKGKLQSSRCFVEHLDRPILPQRLAQILSNFPAIHKHYDASTDSLLLATLAATAPGRFRTTRWTAKHHVRHRVAFKDWKKEQLVPDEYLTPRTLSATGACVPLSSAELSLLTENTSVLFPSDQSVVRVYQTPRGYTWLNIYHHSGDVFGFRQIDRSESTPFAQEEEQRHAMQFCASFHDHSLLHIVEGRALPKKPDGFTTISVTNTFPSGLIVTACSDGTSIQRYISSSSRNKEEGREECETYRLIVGKGTVVRAFSSGKRVILLANGDMKEIGTANEKTEDKVTRSKPERVVDPATNALVERRRNGVVIVTHTDGARVVYHTDGTRMFTNARRSHILVMKADFADVWIDIAVNAAAQRHANGERVAVTKGGLRARSIVDVYDGTRIEVGYNTKVVAQVNGRVTTWKPSGVCIVAKDSGRVEYHRVSTTTSSSSGGSGEDDDLDVTTHNGVYYFDCKQGRFMLCDQEQNQFLVDLSDSAMVRTFRGVALCAPPKISVDLAGVVSDLEAEKYQVDPIPAKAVVNDPIEPHLLILHGDGTAKEILRPRDIDQFLEDSKCSASGNRKEMYSGSQAPNGSSSSPFKYRVFFEELSSSSSSPSSSEIRPLFQDPNLQYEMHRLMKPVNSAAKYLPNYPSMRVPCPQFTIVRRIEQFQPLSASELQEMHVSLHNWTQWQQAREVNKEQYNVVDPRDEDMIAQQLVVQKKVLAAYKATRSRKRLEKQKARELKRKLQMQAEHIDGGGVADASGGGASHMETVQEGDEPHMDEGDDDSDGDEFDYLSGSDSANGGNLDVEVDDPDELLWTAFSQADAANCGKLSIAQARQALVHVLGVGVSTSELMAALIRFKLQDPSHVSFDTFSELVNFFRSSDEDNNDASVVHTKKGGGSAAHLPKLHGLSSAAFSGSGQQQQQEKQEALAPRKFPIAAGSATEAIRLKKTLE